MALAAAGGLVRANDARLSYANANVDGVAGVTVRDAVKINRDLRGVSSSGIYALSLTDSVTISGNLTKNHQLPGGFRLSGTVKDTQGRSVSSMVFAPIGGTFMQTQGSLSLRIVADPNQVYSASAATDTGVYSVVLPAGTHYVSISPPAPG